MLWAETCLSLSGTTGQICEHTSNVALHSYSRSLQFLFSDVSRTSSIAVSAYLRTAQSVQDQEDMGNDILMARVEMTPVLDGHVCSPIGNG